MAKGEEELVARIVEADGPDRELDCFIWALKNDIELTWVGDILNAGIEGAIGDVEPGKRQRNFVCYRDDIIGDPASIPAYTASVDAALTLVPEGWQRESLSDWDAPPEVAYKNERRMPWARATLCGTSVHRGFWGHSGGDGRVQGEAQTLPLAICAAALRAAICVPSPSGQAGEGGE